MFLAGNKNVPRRGGARGKPVRDVAVDCAWKLCGMGDAARVSDFVRVEPIALMPTQAGCAVFLGDGAKVIVFYIDPAVGAAINAQLAGQKPLRPMTHDLFIQALHGFGAKVLRMAIVAMDENIYYARLMLEACNEVMERKIVELDARP